MKYFKLIGIMSLLVFSFYLTDFVTELAINSNPLMQTIKNNSKNYETLSVNATIKNNTIIPGIKGKKVNDMESFLNMQDFGSFNLNYLIYDLVKPEISLEDNKDKIIISGNKSKRQISVLIKNNDDVIKYFIDNNIKFSKLLKINDEILSKYENINIANTYKKFKDLDTILNKKDLNKKICIINYSNIEYCKNNNYYLVKPNVTLNNSNINQNLKFINLGSIILIDDNLTLENLIIFLNLIKKSDIKIVYLSELIKE